MNIDKTNKKGYNKKGDEMVQELQIMLKELRKEKGLTQEQIAKELKVTQKTYSNYENGTRLPNIEMIIEIANFYKIPIDILVGRYKMNEVKK